jgi:hypothetical protein
VKKKFGWDMEITLCSDKSTEFKPTQNDGLLKELLHGYRILTDIA